MFNIFKKKNKEKMIFAKSKREAILAFAILAVFFGNGLYMLINYLVKEYQYEHLQSANSRMYVQKMYVNKKPVEHKTIAKNIGLKNKKH